MKLDRKSVALVALCAVIVALAVAIQSAHAQDAASGSGGQVALPKLLDFNKFKQIFKRSYSSLSEELARRKLFLARAWSAFLSVIGFKHKRATSYETINYMSDWTNDELASTHLRGPRDPVIPDHPRPSHNASRRKRDAGSTPEEPTEVTSEDEIVRELSKIKKDPEFADIAKELPDWQAHVEPASVQKLDPIREPNQNDEQVDVESMTGRGRDLLFGAPLPMAAQDKGLMSKIMGASVFGKSKHDKKDFKLDYDMFRAGPTQERPKASASHVDFDLRKTGCLSEPRNQYACGSCYIFSTTALYEWSLCREFKNLIKLSEQYPLDCGAEMELNGCGGGLEKHVTEFYKKRGFELGSKYPYDSEVGQCRYEPNVPAENRGFIRIEGEKTGLKAIWNEEFEHYAPHAPVLINVAVDSKFHFYGGGITDLGRCDKEYMHSMIIVGAGKQDNKEYWIVRNSYGTRWGNQGHIYLDKSSLCIHDAGLMIEAEADVADGLADKSPMTFRTNKMRKYSLKD